jgi:hypothetical protein
VGKLKHSNLKFTVINSAPDAVDSTIRYVNKSFDLLIKTLDLVEGSLYQDYHGSWKQDYWKKKP